jgi:hypothetical protein
MKGKIAFLIECDDQGNLGFDPFLDMAHCIKGLRYCKEQRIDASNGCISCVHSNKQECDGFNQSEILIFTSCLQPGRRYFLKDLDFSPFDKI